MKSKPSEDRKKLPKRTKRNIFQESNEGRSTTHRRPAIRLTAASSPLRVNSRSFSPSKASFRSEWGSDGDRRARAGSVRGSRRRFLKDPPTSVRFRRRKTKPGLERRSRGDPLLEHVGQMVKVTS